MLSLQLPVIVKTLWSGELKTAWVIEVNAPGVAPEQSMVAVFSVWANDTLESRSSNRQSSSLGPQKGSFISFLSD